MSAIPESFLGTAPIRIWPDGRMDAVSAATYLGLSHRTLSNLRSRGEGPRFIKRGRVFYFKDDLDAWLIHGYSQSTAEARLKTSMAVNEKSHEKIEIRTVTHSEEQS